MAILAIYPIYTELLAIHARISLHAKQAAAPYHAFYPEYIGMANASHEISYFRKLFADFTSNPFIVIEPTTP